MIDESSGGPESKIAFREIGEGPLLLLLHGYAGRVSHWDSVVPELSSSYRVIVPNLGHLFMGKVPFHFSEQVDHLAAFIRHNFSGEAVQIAGMSYGAALTWGLSLRHPELVNKVIFINPMPPSPLEHFAIPVLKSVLRLRLGIQSLYVTFRTPVGRYLVKKMAHVFREERAEHWERMDDLHGRKLLFVCHVIHRFSWILRNENWRVWVKEMKQWNHPTLCVFDEADPLFVKETYEDFRLSLGKTETFYLEGAGHIATHTHGKEIAQRMAQFLSAKDEQKTA